MTSPINRDIRQETIPRTTTDATVTTIWQYSVPERAAASIQAVIVGVRADGDAALIWSARATYNRSLGGAAVLVGETVDVNHKSVSTWLAEFNVSTPIVRVRVTGVAATTIHWLADCTVTVYQT